MGDANGSDIRGLVLLVDDDVESRRHVRHLLELQGMDVVQASNGIAALELIQRLPQSFRLVITELDLPGLSGVMLAETLRLFRPDLRTVCISSREVAGTAAGRQCLSKPIEGAALQAAMLDGHFIQDSSTAARSLGRAGSRAVCDAGRPGRGGAGALAGRGNRGRELGFLGPLGGPLRVRMNGALDSAQELSAGEGLGEELDPKILHAFPRQHLSGIGRHEEDGRLPHSSRMSRTRSTPFTSGITTSTSTTSTRPRTMASTSSASTALAASNTR